ncbi:MAG: hypothetical protein JXX28_03890 [Deltaproteobacteria bacterium]|nr:hypothetical protein [Deltaproteobacteria bacterium]
MDHRALLERIYQAVDQSAYLTPAVHVAPRQRAAMEAIGQSLQARPFSPEATRDLAHALHDSGKIDRVKLLSALHVVAAHPEVRDWNEAARLVGEQELAALDLGGPELDANMAAVERHRGVLAFLRGHHEAALDYFTRSFERERSAENLGNILCALIRLGDLDDARDLRDQVRAGFPAELVTHLNQIISQDPDLALLRTED